MRPGISRPAAVPSIPLRARPIVTLLAAGLALRVGLTLLLHSSSLGTRLTPGSDPVGYDLIAWELAQDWHVGKSFSLMRWTHHIHVGYHFFVALIYFAVGHVPLIVELINATLGAALGGVTYALGRRLYGERAALGAAGLCLFWPSLIYWSTQNLKDTLILFVTALALWAMSRLFEGGGVGAAAMSLAALLALSTLRTYQALLLIGAAFAAYLVSADVPARRRLGICGGALGLLAGMILLFRSFGKLEWNYLNHVSLHWLQQTRDITAVGGSAFLVGANISTIPRLLLFLPRGFLAALLFPLPALHGSLMYRAATPEMLVWYVLLPVLGWRVWQALRARRGPDLLLTFFLAGFLLALASVQGNGGTLLRQRAPVLLAAFLLASPGLAAVAAPRPGWYPAAKRLFDVVGAAVGALVLSPLLATIALGILVTSGRPIFYRQERLGLGKRTFLLVKFRTMVVGADRRQFEYSSEQDPAITRIGRWIRRYSLDELPQLWNILAGDMSLVGPRPMLPTLYEHHWTPLVDVRLQVRPGLTGWQQVNGRNSLTWGEMLDYDAWYVDHASLWLDLRILWRTIGVVLGGEGLYFRQGSQTASDRRPGKPG